MTIREYIKHLKKVQERFGENTLVVLFVPHDDYGYVDVCAGSISHETEADFLDVEEPEFMYQIGLVGKGIEPLAQFAASAAVLLEEEYGS